MTHDALERCVCGALPGFLLEDVPDGGRHVAVGCHHCGTRTAGFPVEQADDAVLAWDAGDFADIPMPKARPTDVRRLGGRPVRSGALAPAKLSG